MSHYLFILALIFIGIVALSDAQEVIKGSKSLHNGTYNLNWELDPEAEAITFSGRLQSSSCWVALGISPHRVWETSDQVTEKQGTGPFNVAMVNAAITVVQLGCKDEDDDTPSIHNYFGKEIKFGNTKPNLVEETYSVLNAAKTYRDGDFFYFEFTRPLAKSNKDQDQDIIDGLNNLIFAWKDGSDQFGNHGPQSRDGIQINFWDPEWEPVITADTKFIDEPLSLLGGSTLLSYMYDKTRITFTIETNTRGWIGMGFKKESTPGMINAYITVFEPAKRAISQHLLTERNNGFPPAAASNPDYKFEGYHHNPSTGRSVFRFSRPLGVTNAKEDVPVALKSTNYWLVAHGAQDSDVELANHGKNRVLFPYDFSPVTPWYEILEWAHGMCMISAWMIFAVMGTFMGRFGRARLNGRGKGLRGILLWFVTHHTWMMFMTAFLSILGFIFILLRQGTVLPASEVFNVWNDPHTMMGFIIIITVIVQGILGAVSGALYDRTGRRGTTSHVAMVHWYIGRVLLVCSFINIYLGMRLVNAHIASYVLYFFWTAFVASVLVFQKPSTDRQREGSTINADEDDPLLG